MRFWRRLLWLLPSYRDARERDMQEELEALKAMAEGNELGNLTLVAEDARDAWRWSWLETLWQDIRFSLRTLRKSPGFTLTAAVVLSVGIGLNLTFFQLINVTFLKPLPVRNAESLALVTVRSGANTLNYSAMEFLRANNNVFSSVLIDMRLSAPEHQIVWENATLLRTSYVSANYFDELGVTALRGRLFSESADRGASGTAARPVAVISQQFWETQLQRDPAVVGATVRLSNRPVTILGVVPRSLGTLHLDEPGIWLLVEQIPHLFPGINLDTGENVRGYLFGRLRPGVSLSAASAGLRPVLDELAKQQPRYRNNSVTLFSGSNRFRQPRDTMRIWGLVGTAGSFTVLVLLITCANLANLVLSRAVSRVPELSVRVSLGASRARIFRHLLTETALLAILASGGGLLMAYWGTRIAAALNRDVLHGDLGLDWRTMVVAAAITVLMTAFVGVLPAWTIGKRDLALAMKDGGEQTSYSLSHVRQRQFLLAAQVGGSCVLLVIAGLMLRTLQQVLVPPGFDYENVLVAERDGVDDDVAPAYWTNLRRSVAEQPGVESVALSRSTPFSTFTVTGVPALGVRFTLARVEPDFFRVVRIPFLSGAPFESSDAAAQPIVLSRSLAMQVFGTINVVGRPFPEFGPVAGVVDDTRLTRPEGIDRVEAYTPFEKFDRVVLLARARTRADAARLLYALPQSLQSVDSRVPTIHLLESDLTNVLDEKRMLGTILSSLAALALAVACMGIFGVVSYSVALRRKEISIRLALGAPHGSIVLAMVRQLVWPVSLAIVAGLIGGVAVGKVFESGGQLSRPDAPVILAAALTILVAVGFACIVPTLRALRRSDSRVLSL